MERRDPELDFAPGGPPPPWRLHHFVTLALVLVAFGVMEMWAERWPPFNY